MLFPRHKKMHILKFCLIVLFLVGDCFATKLWSGRIMDQQGFGMLGPPRVLVERDDQEEWFEQRLDHFDPTNTETWQQRYFVNDEHYNKSELAPIFLFLGGEGKASSGFLHEGQMAQNYAPHYNAFLVLLEHRYYGRSRPTSDMSTGNLKYLTSEQALQDTASFVEYIRKKYRLFRNKLIVFGGSYSGTLAAWFRLKYPHIAAGAVASSAPVEAVMNFFQYNQVMEKSLGVECSESVKHASRRLLEMLESKQAEKLRLIEKKFHLCTSLDDAKPMDISNLVQNIADNFAVVVQYDKQMDSRETIRYVCSIMNDTRYEPLDRLAQVNGIFRGGECFDFLYQNYVEKVRLVDFDQVIFPGGRQWVYQTCTEFGFFQTSDDPDHIFGNHFPLEFFTKQCVDIFGPQFNQSFIERAIRFSNTNYGGWNLTLTNVVFPNGLIDPWHALSILKPINPSAVPIIIEGTSHCCDIYESEPFDPPQLRAAREKILKLIGEFLLGASAN